MPGSGSTHAPAVEGDDLVDTRVWQPVLSRLYGKDVPADHPMRAVGFERENLALNLSSQYRSDLLSLMYGGAAARFTNPTMGEMFSRLVTGRKVERSLVWLGQGTGHSLHPASRLTVCSGLKMLEACHGMLRSDTRLQR